MWDAIEVHGHGAFSSEGVAANAGRWETFLVETSGYDGGFDHLVDIA